MAARLMPRFLRFQRSLGSLIRGPLVQVGGGEAFLPADLRVVEVNSSANNGGFDDGGVPFPGSYISFDPTGGVGGSGCVRFQWTAADDGLFYPCCLVAYTRRGEVYVRVHIQIEPGLYPQGNVKGLRHHDTVGPGNNGELYLGGEGPTFAFDWEGMALIWATGIYYASQPSEEASAGIPITRENLADGTKHTIEYRYNRNAPGGFVEVQIWVDGIAVVLPPGNAYAPGFGFVADVQWVGGDVDLNLPTTFRTVQSVTGGAFTNNFTAPETLSDPTSTVDMRMDRFLVSTTRIGPTQ